MLSQLIHNGVIIPEPPAYLGLEISIRGKKVRLNPEQEEMALAWAKKQGTPYVEDPVFIKNFFSDFSIAMGIRPSLNQDDGSSF